MRIFPRLVLVICIPLLVCSCKTYNEIMKSTVRDNLGSDYASYDYFSYPTNNFGLITAYKPAAGKPSSSDEDFLCDMWSCIGVADNAIPADPKANREMSGFAAVGGNGPIITLTEKDQRSVAVKGALPQIASVLNLAGSVSDSNVKTITMTLGRAYPRKLRRDKMIEFMSSLPATSPMKVAFLNGDLALVVADVMIDSMKLSVSVDSSTAASVDAAMGQSVSKVFSNASLSVNVSKQSTGTYTFDVTSPVIISRLVKHQPGGGVLGADTSDDWRDWIPQNINQKLE